MGSITVRAVGYNELTHDNGSVDIQYINTNAQNIMTVTVGSIGSYMVDGVSYDMPYISYLVFKEQPIPGVLSLSQTITEITAPAGLFDYAGFSTNTAALQPSQAAGFSRIAGSTGTLKWRPVEPDYHYDTQQEFDDAFNNGEIVPLDETCYFDVYINGSDKPNIFVNWTVGESISPVTLQPNVWVGVQDLTSLVYEYVTDPTTGLQVPNVGAWYIKKAGDFSYGGSYETTYLTLQQTFEIYLNPVSKVEHWGLDGDPAGVRVYLQMVRERQPGLTGIGDLFTVTSNKDGTAAAVKISGSSDTPGFYTIVRLHYGEPDYVPPSDGDDYKSGTNINDDDDGVYDEDALPDPDDFTTPEGYDGNGVLTKTYAVSAAVLRNIGQKLWSQDYFNVLKIQNNPIENIVSVKHYPFSMTGASEEVKVGDIAFGINGEKVDGVQIRTIGTYTYTGYFKNYLDLQPFTSVKIYLPYCGLFELNPGDLLNRKIGVEYVIDLVTGQCMAILKMDENGSGKYIPFMNVYGQMGVDVPLTSSDRVQTELRAASAAVTAMGAIAGHIISGSPVGGAQSAVNGALTLAGMDYTTQRTASQSPCCTSHANPDVFLIIERPAEDIIETDAKTGYKHLHGYPCNKYMPLNKKKSNGQPVFSDGSFVAVDARTDISLNKPGFAMTADENKMLEELLTKGVYI